MAVGEDVGVAVNVLVGIAVGVLVGVSVGVVVGVLVVVSVGVGVGVWVGPLRALTTSPAELPFRFHVPRIWGLPSEDNETATA